MNVLPISTLIYSTSLWGQHPLESFTHSFNKCILNTLDVQSIAPSIYLPLVSEKLFSEYLSKKKWWKEVNIRRQYSHYPEIVSFRRGDRLSCLKGSAYKGTFNLSWRLHPPAPFLTPSFWGLRFQHMNTNLQSLTGGDMIFWFIKSWVSDPQWNRK